MPELDQGDFELKIEAPPLQWTAEAIEVEASLTYVGSKPEITVWGDAANLGQFYLEGLDNSDLRMSIELSGQSIRYTLVRNQPVPLPILKDKEWRTGSGHRAFYDQWLADPELHLPPGPWEVHAIVWLRSRCPSCLAAGEELPVHMIQSTLIRATPQPPIPMPAEGCADDFHAPYSQPPQLLTVGEDIEARLTMFTGWSWRNGNGGGDVDYGIYEVHLPAGTLERRAGGSVRVSVGSDFQLIYGRATPFATDSFVVEGGELIDAGKPLGQLEVRYPEAGGLDVQMPSTAGEWVIQVGLTWLTPCMLGNGEIHFQVQTH